MKDVKEMIGRRNLSMTDRYSHLTYLRKLARQVDLVEFDFKARESGYSSEEHIWNTEGKNGGLKRKRAE